MTNNREKLFDKVRAMLAKTVDNGCTEAEAMAALAMADRMMADHEITEDDLRLEDETAVIEEMLCHRDPHAVSWKLCYAVGKFTETFAYGHKRSIKFAGLKSDVDFAKWLLTTLTRYVQSELKKYMWANGYQKLASHDKRLVINGFVIGACSRISKRLRTMAEGRAVIVNSTALVVAKNALIEEVMKNIRIGKADKRGRKPTFYHNSFNAGLATGDKATFGRPIEAEGGPLRLK